MLWNFLPRQQQNELSSSSNVDVTFRSLPELKDDPHKTREEFLRVASSLTPNLRYTNTYTRSQKHSYPTISIYNQESVVKDLKQPDWSNMELWVDFIRDKDGTVPKVFHDPFDDEVEEYPFESKMDESLEIRGRITTYCSAILDTQFRLHTFSIVILADCARLIYWDHCRAVVTELFEYGNSVDCPLREFLVRYSQATTLECGHDPTVVPWNKPDPSSIEYQCLTVDVRKNLHRLQELECDNIKYGRRHREFRRIAIPDRDEPTKIHQVIVSYPPPYRNELPFGRGTRGMKCFNLSDGEILYAKDCWRPDDPYSQCEGQTYKKLEEAGVRNIATFAFGNDLGHKTRTSDLPGDDSSPPCFPLLHYRMALKDIGQPLTQFDSSRVFVSAIADAMEAHDDAYFKAGILHHDISVGNILFKDGKGMLIDWDLAVLRKDLKLIPRNPDRMGTWQFLSAQNITNLTHPSDIEDDRESALYVLLWVALKYTEHNGLSRLDERMELFDESRLDALGNVTGGLQKLLFYTAQARYYPITKFTNNSLNDLINELKSTFAYRYKTTFSKEEEEEANREQKRIKEESWLLGVFRKHLERSWPLEDVSKLNHFTREELAKIRYEKDLTNLREGLKSRKAQKLMDGSALRRE